MTATAGNMLAAGHISGPWKHCQSAAIACVRFAAACYLDVGGSLSTAMLFYEILLQYVLFRDSLADAGIAAAATWRLQLLKA